MYPLIISNACQTAKFNTRYSFGNQMVVSAKKGAIGFIGCSNDSYWDEDYYWAVGTGTISADPTYEGTGLGAFDRLFHTHSEAPSEWYYTMGQINYAGNLSVSASTSSRKEILLGDIQLWWEIRVLYQLSENQIHSIFHFRIHFQTELNPFPSILNHLHTLQFHTLMNLGCIICQRFRFCIT